ncbi:MAG: hypothetical protein ABH854_03935 [Candidatus Diapherotrites archaeon]|nr:hypothetical protein [Candidatus Micrarchaeota archaeon]MBU1939403.1 hypothetical protein [Candidatus Micrarchaeota archaeon]
MTPRVIAGKYSAAEQVLPKAHAARADANAQAHGSRADDFGQSPKDSGQKSGTPSAQGQASIEYLLLVAVFLSFLAFLTPGVVRAYSAGVFGMDVRNAELFLGKATGAADELQSFGTGTSARIEGEPVGEWEISARGQMLYVVVSNEDLARNKELSAELPRGVVFSEPVKMQGKKFVLSLKNTGSGVLAEYG